MKDIWGYFLALDLYGCSPTKIRSKETISEFVIQLCDLIEMKREGDPIIKRFGESPDVYGYSMVQLIQTSDISAHFAEKTNAVYLDIFSCKKYNIKKTREFCECFFNAKGSVEHYIERPNYAQKINSK